MGTPDFILTLRERIGHDPLWLSGCSTVVLDGDRVLLVRRADDGHWTTIDGIVEPGEHPADTAVREAREEAGVEIEITRHAWLVALEPVTYRNGDRCQFLDHGFVARVVSGEPHPVDGETTEARWWPLDALPRPLGRNTGHRIELAQRPGFANALPGADS